MALQSDRPLDPDHEMRRGGVGAAFCPHDLLQLALELRPLEARRARRQVLGEAPGTVPVELAVEVVLDLVEHFLASDPANLGQGLAPSRHPTTVSPGPFFLGATGTSPFRWERP